jgi:hypothetical protein
MELDWASVISSIELFFFILKKSSRNNHVFKEIKKIQLLD